MKHTRQLCLTALFAALAAAGAFVRVPLGATAVTLQFFITALAGMLLGPKWGALSQTVYVILGLAALYLVGVPYLALICNLYLGRGMTLTQAVVGGMMIYLPGDALKIAAAAARAPALLRRLPS